jgi:GrpB-like predicted nucleotidyltransferase (UPF0157 family)
MPEVRDIEAIDSFNDEMRRRGYTVMGEYGLPGRRYFTKGGEIHRSHHVHVYQQGNIEIKRHLAFRDYLMAHPDEVQIYAELKERLAKQFPTDIDAYMDGKDALIKEMDAKALAWVEER